MTQLSEDRDLAIRTLMPRQADALTYRSLTRSGKAEVDRLVEAFREVRRRAVDQLTLT